MRISDTGNNDIFDRGTGISIRGNLAANCAAAAMVAALSAGALPAAAQTADAADIIVTGTIIRGIAENTSMPVAVISSAELAKMGSPTAVELMKALPSSSGVLGDSNQFDSRSQGAEGIATVNLRGLSPQRTLVLLNSHRLATSGNGVQSVDINLMPSAAIGRIEVLKDGAAATYGSDAIAGVVNFITRTDQEGFRAAGGYRFVRSTGGDFDASLSWGHKGEHGRVLLAAGYTSISGLMARDRDFAMRPFVDNPQQAWTGGGNPSTFLLVGPSGTPGVNTAYSGLMADAQCNALGGFAGLAQTRCYTHFGEYDALQEKQRRLTLFADGEVDLGADTSLRVTGLYGRGEVPHFVTSPSYVLTQLPSITALGGQNPYPYAASGALQTAGFYVPASNPGFAAYKAANPAQFAGAGAIATGAVFPLLLYRPYVVSGNPSTMDSSYARGSAKQSYLSQSLRGVAELNGAITSKINWNAALTYHYYQRDATAPDSYGDRVQMALRGFGGPDCTGTTPGANGCLWLNPFSTGIERNAVTGEVNPQYDPATANTAALTDWFFLNGKTRAETTLLVADLGISGSTGIRLPGGEVHFGVGAQFRRDGFRLSYGQVNNILANPCRDTPISGNTDPNSCAPTAIGPAAANGAFAFLGTSSNVSLNGNVKAVFAELQVPLFDSLNIQGAIRYEDYGGSIGSTVDPQVRVRWQPVEWFSLRGGYGTTFRGPLLTNVTNRRTTFLQLVGTNFTPIDTYGNPAVKPEKSKNWSAGANVSFGGFNASVDYFRYTLSDVIVADPLTPMVATLFPSGLPNTCAVNPELAARFTFASDGPCTATTRITDIARVRTEVQNGASQRSEGLDFSASYRADDLFQSDVRFGVGVDATRMLKNWISDIFVAGTKVSEAYDGVGLLNYQAVLYPIPKWKGQGFVEVGKGIFDARLSITYTGGLHDQRFDSRSGPFAPNCALGLAPGASGPCVDSGAAPNAASLLTGADISSFTTADLTIRVQLPWNNTILSGTVFNLFDKDPPFAREDYGYEPFIGNPLGRMFRIGLSTEF